MTNDELNKALREAEAKLASARQAAADAYQAALAKADEARVAVLKAADDEHLAATDAAVTSYDKARAEELAEIVEAANAAAGLDKDGNDGHGDGKRSIKVPAP
jgi:hypothetical protein